MPIKQFSIFDTAQGLALIVFLYHSNLLPLIAVIEYIEEPPYRDMQYQRFQRFNKDKLFLPKLPDEICQL